MKTFHSFHYELAVARQLARSKGAKEAARFLMLRGWSLQTAVRITTRNPRTIH